MLLYKYDVVSDSVRKGAASIDREDWAKGLDSGRRGCPKPRHPII